MKDPECVAFLQEVLPALGLRWQGFRRVRRQVCKRIARRQRALGLLDLAQYRQRLAADPAEWQLLDGLCRVTISRFYRDREVFDRLRADVLPGLLALADRGGAALRCWSAGCASGEEPYTLAMILRFGLASTPRHEILATDADPALLERARDASYPRSALRELPTGWRERAFVDDGGACRLRPALRGAVRFECADLRESMPKGPFHLVLCRNLGFTYFDAAQQAATLAGIAQRLCPGGVLVLGRRESLGDEPGWRVLAPLPVYVRD